MTGGWVLANLAAVSGLVIDRSEHAGTPVPGHRVRGSVTRAERIICLSSGTDWGPSTVEVDMRPVAHLLALACLALAACGSSATDPADSALDVASTTTAAASENGRQRVGLARTVDVSSDGLTLFVGVNSCNGDPSAEVDQETDSITIAVESYVPPGDDQDGCADEVIVSLDEPLGERRIVDEVTGAELRPIRVMPPVQRWTGQVESEAQENNLGVWGVDARLSSGPPDAPKVYRVGFLPEEVTCLSGAEPRLTVVVPGAPISFVTTGDVDDSEPPGVFATSVELDC